MNAKRTLYRDLLRHRHLYLFLIPSLGMMGLFCFYPLFSGIYHSFCDWSGAGYSTWIGWRNYAELATDSILRNSVGTMLKLLVFSMVVGLLFPLLLAELIFSLAHARREYVYRVLLAIPMVVPGIVATLIWGYIYEPNYGLLNQLFRSVGLGHWAQGWLGDPKTALFSIMFMGFPWVGTFNVLIFYAGLQEIPTAVLEAARIDGASTLQRFFAIDLFLLMRQIRLLLILAVIGGIQSFQTMLILTRGGPGWSTYVPGLCMFDNAFRYGRMGYACAIGMVLCLVIILLTCVNMRLLKRTDTACA